MELCIHWSAILCLQADHNLEQGRTGRKRNACYSFIELVRQHRSKIYTGLHAGVRELALQALQYHMQRALLSKIIFGLSSFVFYICHRSSVLFRLLQLVFQLYHQLSLRKARSSLCRDIAPCVGLLLKPICKEKEEGARNPSDSHPKAQSPTTTFVEEQLFHYLR